MNSSNQDHGNNNSHQVNTSKSFAGKEVTDHHLKGEGNLNSQQEMMDMMSAQTQTQGDEDVAVIGASALPNVKNF